MTKVQEILIQNHSRYYRDFVWRHNINPYKILIAEFMLHRTKAHQVEPVYKEFITKYPDIMALAEATYENTSWITKHLGLHWRAEHFIKAAVFIRDEWDSIIPNKRKQLLKIPGVGDYVAGAILTVCFNKREYVVDSNIARYINRFFDLKLTGEIRRLKIIKDYAIELFDYDNSRQLLFALLDFCALICKPKNPICAFCPINSDCQFDIYCMVEKKSDSYAAESDENVKFGRDFPV